MNGLEPLLELTRAMRLAAEAGDFETVADLFEQRQVQLNAILRQGAIDLLPAVIVQVLAQDKEIISLIQRERDQIEIELAKLRAGQRAHQAYVDNR